AAHGRTGLGSGRGSCGVLLDLGRRAQPSWESEGKKAARKARAAAPGSAAPNTAPTTAIRSAPAATRDGALSAVIPPIATRGTPRPSASRSSATVARRVVALVAVGKNAPKAT